MDFENVSKIIGNTNYFQNGEIGVPDILRLGKIYRLDKMFDNADYYF